MYMHTHTCMYNQDLAFCVRLCSKMHYYSDSGASLETQARTDDPTQPLIGWKKR